MFVLEGHQSQVESDSASSTVAIVRETPASLRFRHDSDQAVLDAIKFLAISVLKRVSRYKEAS